MRAAGMVIWMLLLLLCVPLPAYAVVGGGSFYYVQSDGAPLHYQVDAVDYHGIAAWHIVWKCSQINSEHYLRRSDGAPLYTKRINQSLRRSVEIIYGQRAGEATLYRRWHAGQRLERKIRTTGLQDLGSLPQLLLQQVGHSRALRIAVINYGDGKVYHLKVQYAGQRRVGDTIGAIYRIRLDSWLSMLVGRTELVLPEQGQGSFIAYRGPSLDGSAGEWHLRLIGRRRVVAMNAPAETQH